MQKTLTKKITKRGIVSEQCRRSLYRFFKEFLPVIEPNADNYVWNWHIKYLCDELQALVITYKKGDPTYHLNINICPGATKSTLFSRIATAWIWTVFPEATTINVSRDSNNVKEFALKSKEIIKSEKYKLLFPEIELKKEPDSMFFFENTIGGRRYGLTTESTGSTGKHADFVFFDDLAAYKDIEKPETMKSLGTATEGYLSRFKNKERGVVINVMQRLGVDDATSFLFTGNKIKGTSPKLDNYKNICLPAELNDMVYPEELKERYIDGLLDPIRLSEKVLKQEKLKFLKTYDAQYLQKPMLKKEGLMYPEINYFDYDMPEGTNYSFTDIADDGDDYLCTWFIRLCKDGLYVFDAIYTKEGSKFTLPLMGQKMNLYKCILNWIESNNQGSVFISQLMDKVSNIQGKYETSNKVQRMYQYSHLVSFLKFKKSGSPEYKKAIEDMKYLPKKIPNGGKGMDIDSGDAITAVVRYFHYHFPYLFLIK